MITFRHNLFKCVDLKSIFKAFSFITLKHFVNEGALFANGLIYLALRDLDKWDKTAHAKSYVTDTSPKCTEYIFEWDVCSSFLIKCCLKNF